MSAVAAFSAALAPSVLRGANHDTMITIYAILAVVFVVGIAFAFWPQASLSGATASSNTGRDRITARGHAVIIQGDGNTVHQGIKPKYDPENVDGRVYLDKQITFSSLSELAHGKTTLQKQQLLAPFIGHWMKISGVVHNTNSFEDIRYFVYVKKDQQSSSFDAISCTFLPTHKDKIATLQIDNNVIIVGKLTSYSWSSELFLDDFEFVDE